MTLQRSVQSRRLVENKHSTDVATPPTLTRRGVPVPVSARPKPSLPWHLPSLSCGEAETTEQSMSRRCIPAWVCRASKLPPRRGDGELSFHGHECRALARGLGNIGAFLYVLNLTILHYNQITLSLSKNFTFWYGLVDSARHVFTHLFEPSSLELHGILRRMAS